MFVTNKFLVILTTTMIGTVDALYCLSCTAVISPRHCHTIQKCDAGKICFTQRYSGINGEVLFDTGCHTPSICSKRTSYGLLRSHNPAYAHTEQCVECCTSDACNHKGCGGLDYPSNRGPLCFNCPQSVDPAVCSSVKICDENEICHLREEVEFDDSFFVQSCSQKHICNSGSPSIFGKRTAERCLRCCGSDLCNIGCTDSLPRTTTKTTASTTPSTTTTTTKTTTTTTTTANPTTTTFEFSFPFDCWEILHNGFITTGIYQIYPWGSSGKSIDVLCNMDVEPKGWTVFQWRHPLTEDFNRNWEEYKNGFGNVTGEFWLGNEVIHLLTTPHRTLFHIGISSLNGGSWYERFDNMKIASEAQKYTITLGKASGTAGDFSTHASGGSGAMDGCPFSTYDRDNDLRSNGNCAVSHTGGWWFNKCDYVFLNGQRNFTGDFVYETKMHDMSTFNSSILMITRL